MVYDAEELLKSFVEISIKGDDDFLVMRETLTRIGSAEYKTGTLWQNCHILHKRGKYYLVHFRELYALDGKDTNLTNIDIACRNAIAQIVESWGITKILNPEVTKSPVLADKQTIKIIKSNQKDSWKLLPKYQIRSTVKCEA